MPNVSMTTDEFLAQNKELEEMRAEVAVLKAKEPQALPPQIVYRKSDFPWWLWFGMGVLGGFLIATMNSTKPQDKPGFGQGSLPNGPAGTLGTGPMGNVTTPLATPPATQRKPHDPAPDANPPRLDPGVAPDLPPKQASSTHFEINPEISKPVTVEMIDGKPVQR